MKYIRKEIIKGIEPIADQDFKITGMNVKVIKESVYKLSSALSDPHNCYIIDQGLITYVTQHDVSQGSQTFNIAGNASTSLNNYLAVDKSINVVFLLDYSTTSSNVPTIKIDNTTQTVKWNGGAPTSIDTGFNKLSFTIIKTAANTYTVLGSYNKFS